MIKLLKDIAISKKLVYTNRIIFINVGGTNDSWFVDKAVIITWTIGVLEN